MPVSREVQIKNYIASGKPSLDNFEFVVHDVLTPSANQVLVKNLWMSVDPYMRGRMMDVKSYISPFELNKTLEGGALGIVEESNCEHLKPGDVVSSMYGWREYFVADASAVEKINNPHSHLSYHLGVLGMPGVTAYHSLLKVGKPQAGETVFVSGAAGAVGSLVCQIAKLKGCKVVASCGSESKSDWLLNELGVDAVINYKDHKDFSSLNAALQEAAPNGVDVYYDNVGGDHLQAALNSMNLYGRLVMCGMISTYNNEKPEPGPNNLMNIVGKRLTMQGFLVFDYDKDDPEFVNDMNSWLDAGKLKYHETCLEGIDNAPQAFLNLFAGANLGKMLVKLG